MTRRNGLGPLILAGLAAFGYYKYSKMTDEQKRNLKEKGRKLYEENVPESVRNFISKKTNTQTAAHQQNGTHDAYTQV